MEYEVVVYHTITADSHEEAVEKYLDNEMDIDFHEIYWYDEAGNRIQVEED
jgi:hypothetical protein